MNDLVQRLSDGKHQIEVSLRPDRNVAAFKESLERGYVHVRFVNTRGGTELGVPVDPDRSNLNGGDFTSETGQVRVAGELTLDFTRVRCIADIDLATLRGEGWLEPLEDAVEWSAG